MKQICRVLLVGVLMAGAGSGTTGAADAPAVPRVPVEAENAAEAVPEATPQFMVQPLPAGLPQHLATEVPIMDPVRDMLPGVGVLQLNPGLSTAGYATGESVGDGSGLFVTASLDRVGVLGLHRTGVFVGGGRNDVTNFTGVCFWVKGDGSSAQGLLGIGPGLQHQYRFPLSNPEWHKVFVPWNKFSPPVYGDRSVQVFVLAIVPPEEEMDFYFVQQMASYREEVGTGRKRITQRLPVTGAQVVPHKPLIVHYDQLNVEDSDGVMLQIYGSGGPSKGSVAWAWSDHPPLTFPVSKRESVRYYVPWDKLPPPYQVADSKRYLRFHVGTTLTGSHYMVLDRLHFYGEALVEDIQPTVEMQEPEPVDATFFYGGSPGLDPLRKRLADRERLNVVVLGDETLQGYGLGFLEQNPAYLYEHSYWHQWARRLAREFHYEDDLRVFYEVFAEREQVWIPVTKASSQRKRLNVTAMGNNGTTVDFLGKITDRIGSYRPDLLLIQYGMNDMRFSTPAAYEKGLEKVLAWAKEEGVHVILAVPPPVADGYPHRYLNGANYWHRGLGFAAVCRSLAAQYDCTLVDSRAAMEFYGPNRIGNFYTSQVQFNLRGHRFLSKLYFGLFSKEKTELWHEPFPKIAPIDPGTGR